jgi:hypothetical protein
LANAATGSVKNITPKREKRTSKPSGWNRWVWASAFSKRACVAPAACTLCCARSSIRVEMSTPITAPDGPTRRAISSVVFPQPHPTSRTRSPAAMAARSIVRSPSELIWASSNGWKATHLGPAISFQY